ncbi:hypothetical protein Nepgr_019629 [Nepenthes gracilis]|uniref:Uncharacterized protein n=1 Tax=Nepenthes gracilis TaxID=150966 RepID=A0AAD3XUK3_NEPGR|nr:hypothetical protein Nepgr_019629 [Nepenthes gracilis]
MTNSHTCKLISESFIKPKYEIEESKQIVHLAPFDLAMISVHYIQKGLLFTTPPTQDIQALLQGLKDSLSIVLTHFYPLAGQLETTQIDEDHHSSLIFIDCNKGPGARFIYATLDMAVSEILSPIDVPRVVQSFFDHDRAVNHDGHVRPLLSVQVTNLLDGIFIGISVNHVVADGTSYWHFINAWSEIHGLCSAKAKSIGISRSPIHDRWFPGTYGPIIKLPFVRPEEYISRYEAPELRERIFRFSSECMAKLKAKANAECCCRDKVSSFQALSALVWRSITRARCLPHSQETSCRLAINNRRRLDPAVSEDYFGNLIQTVRGVAGAGKLLGENLGWAAMVLHQAVAGHNDTAVHNTLKAWMQSPMIYQFGSFFDPCSVMMGSSPRFDMYGNEFGMGKALAILSGYGNKFDGKVSSYPGCEGGGSVDLEICLPPSSMAALESDEEFMKAVTL